MRASERGGPIICVYIRDTETGIRDLGGAANWWLHHSLSSLIDDLAKHDLSLILRSGDPLEILTSVAEETRAAFIVWNRRYAPAETAFDKKIKSTLRSRGLFVESFNANLLNEPWEIKTGSDQPYKVFTPYWRACRQISAPLNEAKYPIFSDQEVINVASEALDDWELNPTNPNWAKGFPAYWTPGEAGVKQQLNTFLETGIVGYKDRRDVPSAPSTSMLSPYLRFGEISPRQIWHALTDKYGEDFPQDAEKFLAEIGWREFSKTLLFYSDDLAETNWKSDFDAFPWNDDPLGFQAWCTGQTGYPLMDAGMRQLWQTGWMHNRVRMVAASFLIKHLMIDWRQGEKWFWDTLVDADAASNPASWQWVAGCGADAALFFRIFNPILQSERFDPDGAYIRAFVPEIADLPDKYIHAPWTAPQKILDDVGVKIGATYPAPIVDHKFARERALAAYKSIRS